MCNKCFSNSNLAVKVGRREGRNAGGRRGGTLRFACRAPSPCTQLKFLTRRPVSALSSSLSPFLPGYGRSPGLQRTGTARHTQRSRREQTGAAMASLTPPDTIMMKQELVKQR